MNTMNSFMWSSEVQNLLRHKFVVIIGDSVQRTIYKDLVMLLQSDDLLAKDMLMSKGEMSVCGDELLAGGQLDTMSNSISYREVREYQTINHHIRFYFITRVYSDYVEEIVSDLMGEGPPPDILMLHSCVWDVNRYGPSGRQTYPENVMKTMALLKQELPAECLVIWNTGLPVADQIKGGVMTSVDNLNHALSYRMRDANIEALHIVRDCGYMVVDLHFFFEDRLRLREKDGVHWNAVAHRKVSYILLSYVSEELQNWTPRSQVVQDQPPSPYYSDQPVIPYYCDSPYNYPQDDPTGSADQFSSSTATGNYSQDRDTDSVTYITKEQKNHLVKIMSTLERLDLAFITAGLFPPPGWNDVINREYLANEAEASEGRDESLVGLGAEEISLDSLQRDISVLAYSMSDVIQALDTQKVSLPPQGQKGGPVRYPRRERLSPMASPQASPYFNANQHFQIYQDTLESVRQAAYQTPVYTDNHIYKRPSQRRKWSGKARLRYHPVL